ncbi:Protein of unknown function (DUF3006) [Caldicellulosiruptor bescii]|uniref:DUF3006 domain-containing protein n=2 Tax=Caldicellulosiruptor bescii TaxID=31899 RepID=B9MMD0_CALBD|nr:DUF3006 domain-containing protein [Caldicellulosiruptor bescii]ACM59362.1 conserved hypothetical protein [Caldicellulosiruptor bescii DSM 6725]PBC88181.1 Protein of unknown function (DUF3006) [Caldicellulosiruptor bescii]PBC92338.1 Protein of unknown function (DUF3006) [Caldicellulosiruptor bescii]PBD04851.1 Protein of unknown function (DUF3006) [Caldicellulosiruptor bescii]PBD05519.1 Protein of unknown function (DUF3006) [Caldicellulosiruptor bescii]
MVKKVVIDRFEGNFAIVELEGRKMVAVPIEIVPEDAKEGDVLVISIEVQSTQERKQRIKDLFESLREEGGK